MPMPKKVMEAKFGQFINQGILRCSYCSKDITKNPTTYYSAPKGYPRYEFPCCAKCKNEKGRTPSLIETLKKVELYKCRKPKSELEFRKVHKTSPRNLERLMIEYLGDNFYPFSKFAPNSADFHRLTKKERRNISGKTPANGNVWKKIPPALVGKTLRCMCCGTELLLSINMTIDHVIPQYYNGRDSCYQEKIAPCCLDCNQERSVFMSVVANLHAFRAGKVKFTKFLNKGETPYSLRIAYENKMLKKLGDGFYPSSQLINYIKPSLYKKICSFLSKFRRK